MVYYLLFWNGIIQQRRIKGVKTKECKWTALKYYVKNTTLLKLR